MHTATPKRTLQRAPSVLVKGAPDSTPATVMLSHGAARAIPAAPGAKWSSAESVVSRHMPSALSAADSLPAPHDKAQPTSTAEAMTTFWVQLTEEQKDRLCAGFSAECNIVKDPAKSTAEAAERRHDLRQSHDLIQEKEAQARASADALLRQAFVACLEDMNAWSLSMLQHANCMIAGSSFRKTVKWPNAPRTEPRNRQCSTQECMQHMQAFLPTLE